MNITLLLIATAFIEMAAGIGLLIVPAFITKLLLGNEIDSSTLSILGRILGAALFSIGLSSWLEGYKNRSSSRTGLVAGLLAYNLLIVLLLAYAAFFENWHGTWLCPVIGLHLILSIWCIASLRFAPKQ